MLVFNVFLKSGPRIQTSVWNDYECFSSIKVRSKNYIHQIFPHTILTHFEFREAWRTYMKNEGYSLMSNNNKLSKQDYVKYRVVTDVKQPLLYELSILGLGFIPNYLTRWQFINSIVSEVEKYREYCKSLNASDVKKLEGKTSFPFISCLPTMVFRDPYN